MRQTWQRMSPREQQLVAIAAVVVLGALGWIGVWLPMNADLARLARDVPRSEALAANARAQADDIVALTRASAPVRGEPLAAVERVLAERNLRGSVTSLDMQEGRVRMTFAMVRFDALAPLLDALSRGAALVPADITLHPRVEAGFVRAEIALKGIR